MTQEELDAVQALLKEREEEKEKEGRGHFSPKSKAYNSTKIAIVVIAVVVMAVGIFGSTHFGLFEKFSMTDFVSFLEAYKGIFIALIASIGAGGAAKNAIAALVNKKKSENGTASDDGESIAKGG